MIGSSAAPLSRASASSSPSVIFTRIWRPNASVARSCMSVVIATFQPLPSPPTMFSSRDPGLLDEQLVELRLAGDLAERPDLDGVLVHVHQEVRQALVARRVLVRARDEHAPLGVVRERRPDLLARDDPLVAVAHRARLQRREVRARPPARRSPGTRSRRR